MLFKTWKGWERNEWQNSIHVLLETNLDNPLLQGYSHYVQSEMIVHAILHTAFFLTFICCWSTCIISTSNSFPHAQNYSIEPEVKRITYRIKHFRTEQTMLKRNSGFNSGQQCSKSFRNADTHTAFCGALKYKCSNPTSSRKPAIL